MEQRVSAKIWHFRAGGIGWPDAAKLHLERLDPFFKAADATLFRAAYPHVKRFGISAS